jgi:hypothetical protein
MPTDPLAPTDPFSRDDILSMTHQPEASNPVPGIVRSAASAAGDFMQGGLTGVMKGQGAQLPEWSNKVGNVLQSEAANTAIGMASPLKGGMGAPLKAPEAAPRYLITSPEGKSYILKHSLSEQLQELGGDWHSRPVIDAQGNVIHNPINSQHVNGPVLRLNEDGTLTKGILAYHGSPHDFDKFDLSKIGTGEGAQAYGHGLYFAEEEKIAQHYRDSLASRREDEFSYRTNKNMTRSDLAMRITHDTGARTPYAATSILRDLAYGRSFDEIRKGNPASFGPAIDWVERNGVVHEKPTAPEGKMYQVGINADPEHFLDWDRPLSEQHPKVQDLFSSNDTLKRFRDYMEKRGIADPTGMDVTGWMQEYMTGKSPKEPGSAVVYRDNQAAVSDQLRAAGIPGIKYLDQGSRTLQPNARIATTDEVAKLRHDIPRQQLNFPYYIVDDANRLAGYATKAEAEEALSKATTKETSNYVVFDDKMIDILKKYGWAGLGLPAMEAALPSEKNQ